MRIFAVVVMFLGIVVTGAEVTKEKNGDFVVGGSFGLAFLGMCATVAAGAASVLHMKQTGTLPCGTR